MGFFLSRRGFLAAASLALFAASGRPTRAADGPQIRDTDAVPVCVSPDLDSVLVTNPFSRGLILVDAATGKGEKVSGGLNAGLYATLSPDGRYVCFKSFEEGSAGTLLQVPTLYDTSSRQTIALATPAPLAGTPAVSADGRVFYTVGNELRVLSSDRSLERTFDLGSHVNQLALSPDGSRVAFAHVSGSVTVLEVSSGSTITVTDGTKGWWNPKFSPDGKALLLQTVDGAVGTVSASGGGVRSLGKGITADWISADTAAVVEQSLSDSGTPLPTVISSVDVASAARVPLLSGPAGSRAALGGGAVALGHGNSLKFGYLKKNEAGLLDVPAGMGGLALEETTLASSSAPIDTGSTIEITGVPYLNQVYDTADWWNGNTSCNAAAALMCIQYYNILPPHPMTCSTPYVHNHDFGWYVSEIYTWNRRTYDIGSRDPNRRMGYGGFGYITQNSWEDTKGHMAEYISYHGPDSGVDWSPTFAKAVAEVDASNPFVVLTSLTDAGHYPVCIGYHKSLFTLVFADPYGDKNQGYKNYNGQRALYDWPGYNNGYQNLNIVHCYIWSRLKPPVAPSNLVAAASGSSAVGLTWLDSPTNEKNYIVARGTAPTGPFTDIATLDLNATSYTDSGLTGALSGYYYVVRAVNARGTSANSNVADVGSAPAPPPADIIIDNTSPGFTASANWTAQTKLADKYGADCRIRSTAAVSDSAVWSFTVPETRNYEVFVWWSAAKTRASNAPYILPNGTVSNQNQQANGGRWNSLGVHPLAAGTHTVKLSCWTNTANQTVSADAVKIVAR